MDIFIYKRQPLKPNKHYLIVDNYPIPISAKKGLYIKRTTVAIDVTEFNIDPNLNLDFESIIEHYKISAPIMYAIWGYANSLSQEPDIQKEADDYLDVFYRKE